MAAQIDSEQKSHRQHDHGECRKDIGPVSRLDVEQRVTPAMAAGVTDRLWGIGDIVKVLEDWEAIH